MSAHLGWAGPGGGGGGQAGEAWERGLSPWRSLCLLIACCSLTRPPPSEYPDFYRKLYGLLDPSVFHVKYRARFFHLADLFLSSS